MGCILYYYRNLAQSFLLFILPSHGLFPQICGTKIEAIQFKPWPPFQTVFSACTKTHICQHQSKHPLHTCVYTHTCMRAHTTPKIIRSLFPNNQKSLHRDQCSFYLNHARDPKTFLAKVGGCILIPKVVLNALAPQTANLISVRPSQQQARMEVKHSSVPHLVCAAAPPYFLLLLSHSASPQQTKKKVGQRGNIGWANMIFIMVRLWVCLPKY